jgi:predicted O-methyltransferase YrrM
MVLNASRVQGLVSNDTVYVDVEAAFPASTSAWPIDRAMGRLLARLVVELGIRDVLEFGAGTSSVVFAQALARIGGGRLTSVEEDPAWSVDQWAIASTLPTVDARMIASRVFFRAERRGLYHGYTPDARAAVAARGPYSLVLIDGPDGYIGRDGALHLVFGHLAPNALVVVDDAKRRKEKDTIARWMAVYPGLTVLADAPHLGHGVAILGYSGDTTQRTSTRALVSSAVREAYAWVRNLTYQPPVPPAPTPPRGTRNGTGVHVGDDQR